MSVAFIFPGQGSQSLGMLSHLAQTYSEVNDVFDEVSTRVGYDVWRLTQDGPLAVINQTEHTQVVMLAADVAVFRCIESMLGSLPKVNTYFVGHSLGEYAALVCANSLSLGDAAVLVKTRGQLMQEACPLECGAMAAIIGLADEQVRELCMSITQQHAVVSPANYNALGQVVIAGHRDAVIDCMKKAEQSGAAMVKLLPVSVPCHCDLLAPAAEKYLESLNQVLFSPPKNKVVSSIDLALYSDVDDLKQRLAAQLVLPVRWVDTVLSLKQWGVTTMIECGPGKVLAGLVKRIDKTLPVVSGHDPVALDALKIDLNKELV